jgi:hypothetical protein
MIERASPSWILVFALAFVASGCSALNDFGRFVFDDEGVDGGTPDSGMPDSGTPDAGPDAGTPDGGGVDGGDGGGVDGGPGPVGPTAVVQTSGGAVITTPTHRLRVSVGAPQPVGARRNASHRVRVGPVPR